MATTVRSSTICPLSIVIFEKLIVTCMESVSSITSLEEPIVGTYPESNESLLHLISLFL
jgi:hypothetical protein